MNRVGIGRALLAWLVMASSASARTLAEILEDKGVISHQEAAEAEKSKPPPPASQPAALPEWVRWLTPFGDVAVRNESGFRKGDPDRVRQRFRLRFGVNVRPSDELEVAFKIASGNPDNPISNFQTFTDDFTFKDINISNAYIRLTPSKSIGLQRPWVTLLGGKFDVPFYLPPTQSRLVYDRDLTPEGFAEALKVVESKDGFVRGLTLNLGQWIFQENTDTGDAAIYAFQGVGSFAVGDVQWNLGIADYQYVKPSSIAVARNGNTALIITNTVTLSDGTVVGGKLVNPATAGPNQDGLDAEGNPITIVKLNDAFNDFNVATDLTIPTGWERWPFRLFGDYVVNTAASNGQDQGFEVGTFVGGNKDSGDAWFSYAYEWLETDAVISAFTESELGRDGGTNNKGHVLQLGYVLTRNLSTLSTAYIVEPLRDVAGRNPSTDVRWQVDLHAKF
jgi:hypothetical protein